MLANYIAEYIAYQYAQRERAENLISTIANEFLEAVVNLAPADSALVIRCAQEKGGLRLNVEHQVHPNLAAPYIDFVKDLCQENNNGQYLDLLTSTRSPDQYFNQLGLTMLAHDFGACLEVIPAENNRILTRILIATQEFQS